LLLRHKGVVPKPLALGQQRVIKGQHQKLNNENA